MAKRDIKEERFKEFLAESEEILNTMGKALLKLGKGVKAGVIDHSVLNSVFRSAHTLKGMSGIFEFRDMTTLSHSLEDTLDMLRLGRVALTDEVLDCVLCAHDLLTRITGSKGKGDFSSEIVTLQARLESSRHARKHKGGTEIDRELLGVLTEYEEHRLRENLKEGKNIFVVNVKFPITSFDKGYLSLTELLKTEAEVIATLPSNKTNQELLYFDILTGTDRDKVFLSELIKDVAASEINAIAGPEAKAAEEGERDKGPLGVVADASPPDSDTAHQTLRRVSDTVRVSINKLDNIMHIVSELGIFKTTITRLAAEVRNDRRFSAYGIELARAEKYLERKLTELRDGVLDVRMVPIGQLFGRFDTFINKLSREAGKEFRIVTYGDETELDKLIAEELADPLMHIIRNVTDHGIEAPDLRESLGKPRTGTITLSAYQKGNHVVVEVKDDGVGIDVDVLKEKAVEKALVTRKYAESLSAQEALELIFLPGFTTRDSVSETSGRGVGMDVVKENITTLSGIIDIDTVKGKGTRFMLTIPITLAIIQALIVETGGVRYAVPLNSVIEIIELAPHGAELAVSQEFITLNDRNIPSVYLSTFFGKESKMDSPAYYGIVAGLAEHRVCIIVDSLVEELDVVIKPLSRILKVQGVAGATDMGEKGTILVLDVTGILDMALKERKSLVRA